jgi:CBS domain-containing protein
MPSNRMLLADVALVPVICVQPGTSLAQAARVLSDIGVGVIAIRCEPLRELSDADVVDALAAGRSPGTHLEDLQLPVPQFARPETTAEDAAATMIVTGRRALVVVDEGRPLGVVRLRDIAGALWGGQTWLGAFRVALHIESANESRR